MLFAKPRAISTLGAIAVRLRRALALLGLIAALGSAPAAMAQSIGARGAEHEDFGRLVLDFTQPVASQIVANGAHMEVRLGRASAIDLAGALGNLKTYLKSAKLSPDRRRLDLDFTGPVTWKAFNDGTKLALDFALADESGQQQFEKGPDAASAKLAPEGATAAPAVQAGKAATPAPLPKVSLRAGEHQSYSRLAFDWPKDVPYQIRQSGDQLDLVFGSPANVDLDGAVGDLPLRLNSIGTNPKPNGVTVHMQTKPNVVVRDFRSGHTIVIDIYDRNAADIPPPAQAEMPALASAAPQPAEDLLPVPSEVPTAPSMAQMTPLEAEPAPSQEIVAGPEPAAPPEKLATDLQSALPQPAETPPAPVAGAGASGPGVAVPVAAAPTSTFEPPRVAPPAVQVNVSALPASDGATLYFDWPKPTALAVFRRGDAIWLVFDVPGKADLRPLKRLESTIGKIEPVASSFSLALRLIGGKAGSVVTATEGARWKVTLRPGNAMNPTKAVLQKRETLPTGGTSLYVQAIASGASVDLKDPQNAAHLVVIPGEVPGLGTARESDWPDFKLLPTHQGVVVELLSDATTVHGMPNGAIITTPGGAMAEASKSAAPATPPVATTPPPAATPQPEASTPPATASIANAAPPATAQAKPAPAAPVSGLFDLDKWRGSGPDNFLADQAELKARVDSASPADRNKARLDFAEFYLANGYSTEAATWIELIRHDDPTAQDKPLIMAIGAAAYTMADDRDRASRLLSAPALKDVPEANLMRAVIAAEQGRTEDAAKLFSGPLPDLKPYPKLFRTHVREKAAEALLDYGDPLTAQNFIDPLKADKPDADAAARADYLDALRMSKLGQKDAARTTLAKLQDSPVDEIKARARFALISQQLDEKSIDPAEAAKQLEALRFLWRGDTFEFDLLYKLGKLYFAAGQPRRSLITLRQAATHFPDHPLAKQAAADMASEFRDLYLGGEADKLSPLAAVGLYNEFRELTPPGAEGDRMISAFADRLVKLDVFDSAGEILERQVKTRLSGADKVSAGTRLAAIRLLDDKPDLALAALKASEDPAGSPGLMAERKRLQARALFDTGDTLKGIDLVRDDTSLEGLWLKSDMFWKLKEWPSAAQALGQLIEAEQARRAAAKASQTASTTDIAKNPATVLDNALAQAQATAAADAANAAPDANAAQTASTAANTAPAPPAANGQQQPAAAQPAAPQFDPVLASLVMNRAVALSLANDRRGLKEIARSFGKDMAQSALAQPFQVLTSPDTGLAESITAQMKSVDQLGSFVDEYKKILKSESLSGVTEPNPDTGPTVPMENPNSGAAPSPAAKPQTADQAPPQPSGQ